MKRTRLVYWGCAFLLILCFLLKFWGDRPVFSQNGLQTATIETSYRSDGGYMHVEPGNAITNPVSIFDPINVPAGAYQVRILYSATHQGNTLVVTDPAGTASDNTVGAVYASFPLDPAKNSETFTFTLDRFVENLQLHGYYGGEGVFEISRQDIIFSRFSQTDYLWLAFFVLIAALWGHTFLFSKKAALGETLYSRLQRMAPVLFVLGVALFISYPFYADILPRGHDINFHLSRLEGLAEGLRDGAFPVRMNPLITAGKGYASPMLYPDFFLYPFALLRLAGFSLIGCWQLFCILINVFAALFSYFAARHIFSSQTAGLLVSILYTLAPYRISNLTVRAAYGEALAMTFLPLLIWGLHEVFFNNEKRWPILLLGYSGVLQSHILSLLICSCLMAVFCLCFFYRLWREKARLASLIKAAACVLACNLWFILPFVYFSLQPLRVTGLNLLLEKKAIYPLQLFFSFPSALGFDSGVLGSIEGMPLNMGVPLLFVLCLALALPLFFRGEKDQWPTGAKKGLVFAVFGILCLWTATTLFPWKYVVQIPVLGSMLSKIQFPWRFLSPASMLLAMCGGVLAVFICGLNKKLKSLAMLALTLFCLIFPAAFLDSWATSKPTVDYYTLFNGQEAYTLYMGGEYYYEETDPELMAESPQNVVSTMPNTLISAFDKKGTNISFTYRAEGPGTLQLPLVWYPGYKAVDGSGVEIENVRAENGLVLLLPTEVVGQVTVHYAGPWWVRLGDVLCAVFMAACLGISAVKRGRARATAFTFSDG